MTRLLFLCLTGAMTLAGLSRQAEAQSCSASASSVQFGSFSPIRQQALDASGSVVVTCNWPVISLIRNARVCLNLGAGAGSAGMAPRQMLNGGQALRFNLYRDAARSQIWGSVYQSAASTPISVLLTKPLLGTSASTVVNFYGRIESNQPDVPVSASAATTYSLAFSGNHTLLGVHFFELTDRSCAQIQQSSGSFSFTAQAQVINDCTIAASDLNFPSSGTLNKTVDASASLNVRCTRDAAWRIGLSAGNSADLLNRRMDRIGGSGSVRYQLYTNSSRSTIWGNGYGGTSLVGGTGTGLSQQLAIYGRVPAQKTPMPGAYRDTIIATITF